MDKGMKMTVINLEAEAFGGRAVLHPTLVWDEEAAVLIDTGMPGGINQIREAMHEAGVPFARLKAVILTHQDLDHISGLPEILDAAEGRIEVYAHELDQPYIEGTLPLIKTNPDSMAKMLESLPEDVRREALALCESPPKAKVDRILADGDVLPLCGGIHVVFTPGHTPGHINLYLPQYKALVAGDALICANGSLRGPIPQNTLDLQTAYHSLEKLIDLDLETVICYHGGTSSGNVKEQLRDLVGP